MNLPPELSPILGALGGAASIFILRGARWAAAKFFRARVQRETTVPDGPRWGTIGWVWQELGIRISEVRSKGHANEAYVVALAQRMAAVEQEVFGAARLASGEQERIDYQRERSVNDTEPAPSMFDDRGDDPRTPADPAVARARRRSRP